MSGGRRRRRIGDILKRQLEDIERQEMEQELRRKNRTLSQQGRSLSASTEVSSPVTASKGGGNNAEEVTKKFRPSRNLAFRSTTKVDDDGYQDPPERVQERTSSRSTWQSKKASKRFEGTESKGLYHEHRNKRTILFSDDDDDEMTEYDSDETIHNNDERKRRSRIRQNCKTKSSPSPPVASAAAIKMTATMSDHKEASNDSDSDSIGSFNMITLYSERKKRRRLNDENKSQQDPQSFSSTASAQKIQGSSTDVFDDGSGVESFDRHGIGHEKNDLDQSIKKSSVPMKTDRGKTPKDDFLSSEDDNSVFGRHHNHARVTTSSRRKSAKRTRSVSTNRTDDRSYGSYTSDSDKASRPQHQSATSRPKNPIALEREAMNQFLNSSVAVATSRNTERMRCNDPVDDDGGFMSDCEPIPSTPNSVNKETIRSSKYNKKHGSKERNKKSCRDDRSRDDHDTHFEREPRNTHNGSLDDLHPEFTEPKFGPYEPMQPLVLSGRHDEAPVEVPASLNRYLAPFQKEGVRFMYDCLARKSGVILGDEMGCGKTVQVISLLCALFHKTGTWRDQEAIRIRYDVVQKQKRRVESLRDEALRRGQVMNEDIEHWKSTSLSLSDWNPVMVIVPPTIVDTWKNAFKTFSHFSVAHYSSKSKAAAIDDVLYGNADVLLVPKSLFQNELHVPDLERVKWKLIVIDEFHNFKNHKAKISLHLRKLKELHHPLILGMTGTPMQNNHTELWNLVDLVETNYLGSQEEFKHHYDRPITLGRQKCADPRIKSRSEVASAELRRKLNKIYIKRDKTQVLKDHLPDKTEEVIMCNLSPLQKEVYKICISLPDFDLVKHGSRPCDCGINRNFFRHLFKLKHKTEQLEYLRTNKSQVITQSKCCQKIPVNPRYEGSGRHVTASVDDQGEPFIDPDAVIWRTLDAHCTNETVAKEGCDKCPWCCTLPCLTKLNKISSHLGLLQASKTQEPPGSPAFIKYIKEREFAKVSLAGVASRLPGGDKKGGGYDRSDGIMDDHFSLSGKLRVLNMLLQKYYDRKGKVLLFSHSTQTLDLIQNWLRSRGTFEYIRMDGSTPPSKRQQLTDDFNNDEKIFVFLLSIKATGLGLNLTSANRVIMFDVSWNPSWEIQAQDRAHRIGQRRDVRVVRLISKGTVEEMIYLRQVYKIHLKQDTLQDHDDEEKVAPRVFRGVQGDKYRKGEIFGTENLFRFKEDGSFLDSIWKGSKPKRNRDLSGIEIYDSGELSKLLLGMTDQDREKIGESDEMKRLKEPVAERLKKVPEKPGRISQGYKMETDIESIPDVDDIHHRNYESDQVSAMNHEISTRSGRAGAAISSSETGFDEEMGGQTQAAYELYENVKDDLTDDADLENTNDDIRSEESNGSLTDSYSEKKSKVEMKNPATLPAIETRPGGENNGSALDLLNSPTRSYTNHSSRKGFPKIDMNEMTDLRAIDNSGPDRNKLSRSSAINSIATMNANYPQATRARQKLVLMGCMDITNATTLFSASDIRRPNYSRKKKKK